MADIALGSAVRVVNVALAIKNAVDTAEQNIEDCEENGRLADQVKAHTERLIKENREVMANSEMRDTLEAMADCLDKALRVINKCRGKCFLLRYLMASGMSKQLGRALDAMSRQALVQILAINVDANIGSAQRPQYAGQAGNPQSSQPRTDQARPEVVKNEKGNTMVATVRREESDELNIRAKLQHRNISKEYMPNAKSLKSIINGMSQTSRLDWPSCFKIIQGIAKGLHYLHKQRVLYMDLKPANILVRSDMDPVIIVNFQVSVVLDGDDDTIPGDALTGTLGYIAPEKIRRANVSLKSDVFSFGVILFEVVTGTRVSPFVDLPEWSSVEMIRSMKGLFDPVLVDESQLMKINKCREVGLKCIEWDPRCRPTMTDVLEMLNS